MAGEIMYIYKLQLMIVWNYLFPVKPGQGFAKAMNVKNCKIGEQQSASTIAKERQHGQQYQQ